MSSTGVRAPAVQGLRVVAGPRRGSSRPVVVETEDGLLFVKLRGAAQGPAALVAEVIVAELADALGLPVPRRTLVRFPDPLPSDDRDGELLDLLARSRGLNLGFRLLQNAREIRRDEIAAATEPFACAVLWLDALVLNRDRTPRNPNILVSEGNLFLIDHGAALTFHHDWSAVTEESPRKVAYALQDHLFHGYRGRLPAWDARLARTLTRDALEDAVAAVPGEWLQPLPAPLAGTASVERRRRAYEAFLWKRLRAPRPFVAGRAQDKG